MLLSYREQNLYSRGNCNQIYSVINYVVAMEQLNNGYKNCGLITIKVQTHVATCNYFYDSLDVKRNG